MTFAICYDELFKDHKAAHDHPEKPERLDAVLEGLKLDNAYNDSLQINPREATIEELETVHSDKYVGQVTNLLKQGSGNLDPDTFYSEGTLKAALCAAGGAIDVATAVHSGEADWGFAAVRPPGHHATADRAYGFCIFNNIAVAPGGRGILIVVPGAFLLPVSCG